MICFDSTRTCGTDARAYESSSTSEHFGQTSNISDSNSYSPSMSTASRSTETTHASKPTIKSCLKQNSKFLPSSQRR